MEEKEVQQAIFIAGPTASGKSAVALALAEQVGGEIINADAMQIYSDLRVLTARPGDEDLAGVPHHLYGTMDGAERCSAGIWAHQAASIVTDVLKKGSIPILVGGTGLYLKALDEGLSPIPDIPPEIRKEGQILFEKLGSEAFRSKVLEVDPAMAWLASNDRQRLVRAWEVYAATGSPLSEFQALPREPLLACPVVKCVISPPREQLYAQCDQRFEQMLEEGAVAEVEELLARKLDPALPVMKSLGVPELAAYLSGDQSREKASELAKRNTRRFAKRQQTWFKGQASNWPIFAASQQSVAFLAESCSMSRHSKR